MHSNRNLFNWFFFTFVVSLVPMTIYLLCTWFIVDAATERTVFTHEFIFFSIVLLTSLMKTVLFGNIKRVYRLRALGIGIVSALVLIVAFGLFALIIVSETTTMPLRFIDQDLLARAFLHCEKRKADKSGCISFGGKKYDLGVKYAGRVVDVVFDPANIETLTIPYAESPCGFHKRNH